MRVSSSSVGIRLFSEARRLFAYTLGQTHTVRANNTGRIRQLRRIVSRGNAANAFVTHVSAALLHTISKLMSEVYDQEGFARTHENSSQHGRSACEQAVLCIVVSSRGWCHQTTKLTDGSFDQLVENARASTGATGQHLLDKMPRLSPTLRQLEVAWWRNGRSARQRRPHR
jgi:hypothetical protein